jgi:hypothetical protein
MLTPCLCSLCGFRSAKQMVSRSYPLRVPCHVSTARFCKGSTLAARQSSTRTSTSVSPKTVHHRAAGYGPAMFALFLSLLTRVDSEELISILFCLAACQPRLCDRIRVLSRGQRDESIRRWVRPLAYPGTHCPRSRLWQSRLLGGAGHIFRHVPQYPPLGKFPFLPSVCLGADIIA